jgi:hypothetical protein
MGQLLNGNTSEKNANTSKKNDKIARLCKPPSLHEMNKTEMKYFSLPNESSREIMLYLGCYYLLELSRVNHSFNILLNPQLNNEPLIFGYRSKEIDHDLLERLYNEHKVSLNEYKATCCKGRTTPRSMITCSTEWPDDIDPRSYHILIILKFSAGKYLFVEICQVLITHCSMRKVFSSDD